MPALYLKTTGIASLLLLLSACGQPEVVVSTPPAEWSDPVPEPAVPEEATDEAVADYIISLVDALRAANGKLLRIKDWGEELEEQVAGVR